MLVNSNFLSVRICVRIIFYQNICLHSVILSFGLLSSFVLFVTIIFCQNIYLHSVILSFGLLSSFVLSVTCHRGLGNLEMLLGEFCTLEKMIPLLCHLHCLIFVMQLQAVAS